MGPNSTAGIFSKGEIDTDWEVLMNVYGTAYDSLDGMMLTKDPHKLDQATINEVKGRFFILKKLAKKHCPQKLETIKRIEQITYDNIKGKISDPVAQNKIRSIIHQQRMSNSLLDGVELKINIAQGMAQTIPQQKNNFAYPIAQFMKQNPPKQTKQKQPKYNNKGLFAPFFSPTQTNGKKKNTYLNPPPLFNFNQQPKKRRTTKGGRK